MLENNVKTKIVRADISTYMGPIAGLQYLAEQNEDEAVVAILQDCVDAIYTRYSH